MTCKNLTGHHWDVLEFAREKGKKEGIQEGKTLGIQEGRIDGIRKMLLDALFEKYGVISSRISQKIQTIDDQNLLESLFRQVFRCDDIRAFEALLDKLE